MMIICNLYMGLPHSSVGKKSACNAGEPGSIPRLGRSSGEGNDSPLQYSCLKNPMDRGAWQATVRRVARVRYDLATKPPQPLYNYISPTHDSSPFFNLNDTRIRQKSLLDSENS